MINCVLYVFLIFQEIGQWVNNCKYENFEGLKLDQRFTKRFESLCRPDCRQGMVKKLQWQSCCYTCANRTARQIIEPSGLASDCQWGSWPDDDLSRCHPLTQRPLGKRNDYVFFLNLALFIKHIFIEIIVPINHTNQIPKTCGPSLPWSLPALGCCWLFVQSLSPWSFATILWSRMGAGSSQPWHSWVWPSTIVSHSWYFWLRQVWPHAVWSGGEIQSWLIN